MSELKIKGFPKSATEANAAHKLIPAELYGKGIENKSLRVDIAEFNKVYAQGGQATVIDLDIDGKVVPVVVKSVQRDPLKDNAIHVDFYQVQDNLKIVVEAALQPVGKSHAIANMGGMLVKNMQKIKIECLPANMVNTIEVDLAKLDHLKAVIRTEDLTAPEGVAFKNNPRDAVFTVMASRKAKAAATAATPAKKK